MNSKIVIYGATYSHLCMKAKKLLQKNKVPFIWLDINQPQKQTELLELQKQQSFHTIPVIYVGNRFIGGYSDFIREIEIGGVEYRQEEPINAFLYPQDPNAQYMQIKPPAIIDRRSTAIPGAGREWSGANRNKPKQDMKVIINHEEFGKRMRLDTQKLQENQVMKQLEGIELQKNEPQTKFSRSLLKRKKLSKSKLRKTMVF